MGERERYNVRLVRREADVRDGPVASPAVLDVLADQPCVATFHGFYYTFTNYYFTRNKQLEYVKRYLARGVKIKGCLKSKGCV